MTGLLPAHRPVPKESADRCALRSQLRGDPMPGTGFPSPRVLLVEQDGPWGKAGLPTSRFDTVIANELITRAATVGVRVLAVRRPGRHRPRPSRRWMLVDTRAGRRSLHHGVFERDEQLRALPLDGSAGDLAPADTPLWLVCTHGKHDPCCALRGRPVAAALAEVRPRHVWECSHLGGERFAANVLVLPTGLLYGRVLPFAAPGFVQTVEEGGLIAPLLRGRIGHPAVVQAAMVHAYGELALSRVDDLQAVSSEVAPDGGATVRLELSSGGTREGLIDVHLAVERVVVDHLTCDRPGTGAFQTYRPVRITPVR